ncbi:MAG: T9SS type A sorting domain-containing protein [Saprospiraceae bacterium]
MSKVVSIVALLVSVVLLLSNASNPPNGNTGAPGENTCGTNCHHLNGGTQDGTINVAGIPALIEPNMAYVLTVTATNPNGVASLAGFQLTVLDNANAKAGNITMASAGSTTQLSSGRQYWEHNPAQPFPGSNTVTWTATWTASNIPANSTVTYYIAANIANGANGSNGDLILTDNGGGMMNGGGSTLTVSITNSTNLLCNGQNTGSATASASGGATPYSYHWSNGASGATINNLAAGTYTVTVTDNTSATATANVIITQPTLLVLTAPTITNVLCNGGNTGSITAHASGGISPYSFDWSTGAGTATISNLSAGPYTVTVTDDNGCTKTSIYQITQPQALVINLVSLTHESCFGQDDGAITISVSGGVNPIIADWSNGFSGTTINNLAPGTYSVTVSDNNNCTKTSTYTINAGGIINVNLNQLNNVSCPGGANGSISVTASGGIAPYTYAWSNGSSASSISGLGAGTFTVTASDSHGCMFIKVYTITQPQAFVISILQLTQNVCFGNSTADLTSSTTGGTSPYAFSWSNGVNGSNNSNLPAGTYTLTVTDDHGCTSSNSTIIIDPAQVTVSVSTTDQTGVGLNDGTATANPSGGTGAFTYLWSNDSTTAIISGLPPGMYSVTVADTNACSISGSGQVDPFGCLLDLQLGTDVIICEGDTALVLPFISGETGNVSYLWSDGSTGDSLLVAHSGEYCLTITDGGGCQDEDCIVITEIIIPSLNGTVTNESFPGAQDGSITCESGFVNYFWSIGAVTESISGLPPGVYCVTVTDNNGCTKSACFSVLEGNCQLTISAEVVGVSCFGNSTGAALIIPNNEIPPVSYIWSTGDTTSSITGLPVGNYSVTVSDASGCLATDIISITSPDSLIIELDTVIDITEALGAIHVTISGGQAPYFYTWTFPDGTQLSGFEDLDNLNQTGNYHLEIHDSLGCIIMSSNIFLDTHVAVYHIEKNKSLKVYPVPADDVLIVDIENEMTEVLISGIDGRLVKRFDHPQSNHLDVGDLESGWYIIRISDGKSWYIARIVK